MKKKLTLLTAVLVIAATLCISLSPLSSSVKITRRYGDIDCDGYISLQDVVIALQTAIHIYPREITGMDLKAGDLNGNGQIDTADARRILRICSSLEYKQDMESYEFEPDINRFLTLCNTARVEADGKAPLLKTSKDLCKIATAAAEEFAVSTGSALRRADGSYYYKALSDAGITFTTADKFIQVSTGSTDVAFEKIMENVQNSKTVCNRAFKNIGVGAYSSDGKTFYWCVILYG